MKDDNIIKFIASIEERDILKIWDTLENYLESLDENEWPKKIYNKSDIDLDEKETEQLTKNIWCEFNKLKKTPNISLLKLCNYDYDELSSLLNYKNSIEDCIYWLFYKHIKQIYSEKSIYFFQGSINLVVEKYHDNIINKIKNVLKKTSNTYIFPNSEDYDFWENYCVNLQSYQLNGFTYEVERSTIIPTIESVVAKINPYWLQLIYLYKNKEFYEENKLDSIIGYNINSKSDNSYLIDSITIKLLDDIRDIAEAEGIDITFEG